MPANMRLHVVFQGDFGEIEGFGSVALAVQYQGFHSLCIGMIGVLLQHLLCCLQAWRMGQLGRRLLLPRLEAVYLSCTVLIQNAVRPGGIGRGPCWTIVVQVLAPWWADRLSDWELQEMCRATGEIRREIGAEANCTASWARDGLAEEDLKYLRSDTSAREALRVYWISRELRTLFQPTKACLNFQAPIQGRPTPMQEQEIPRQYTVGTSWQVSCISPSPRYRMLGSHFQCCRPSPTYARSDIATSTVLIQRNRASGKSSGSYSLRFLFRWLFDFPL